MHINGIIRKLVLLLVFLFPINMSIVVGDVVGAAGQRVSLAATTMNGVLTLNSEQMLHLGLVDIVIFAIFCLLVKVIITQGRSVVLQKVHSYKFLLLFIFVSIISLLINRHLYSSVQFLICALYLLKFFIISLVYLYVLYYLYSGGSRDALIKVLLCSVFIAAIIGVVDSYTGWFANFMIRDRVSYYTVLALIFPLCFIIGFKVREGFFSDSNYWFWKILALINMELILWAVIACYKRGVEVAIVVALIFLLFTLRSLQQWLLCIGMATVVCMLSFTQLEQQYVETFGVHKQYAWQGLEKPMADRLKNSTIDKYMPTDLSYSVTDRIARNLLLLDDLRSLLNVTKNQPVALKRFSNEDLGRPAMVGVAGNSEASTPVVISGNHIVTASASRFPSREIKALVGIGYWGVIYVLNYLPDSFYLQVILETGILGALCVLLFFWGAWKSARRMEQDDRGLKIIWTIATAIFLIVGLTANIFYVFNVLAVYLIVTAIVDFSASKKG